MSAAERLLSGCSKVRTIRPGEWSACCPAHEDRSPSLSVRELPDGTLLVHCFAGCSIEEITLAAGMHVGDLFPRDSRGPEHSAPLRRSFDAHAVLAHILQEAEMIYVLAGDMYAKHEIGSDSYERLGLAIERIQEAIRLANGEARR